MTIGCCVLCDVRGSLFVVLFVRDCLLLCAVRRALLSVVRCVIAAACCCCLCAVPCELFVVGCLLPTG